MAHDKVTENNEIGFLDLLLVLAENWLLLLAAPVLVAGISYVIASAQVQSYRSTALVSLPHATVAAYLDGALIEQADLPAVAGISSADIEQGLKITQGDEASETRLTLALGEREAVAAVFAPLLDELEERLKADGIVSPHDAVVAQMDALAADIALRERMIDRLTQISGAIDTSTSSGAQTYAQGASALNQLMTARDVQKTHYDSLATDLVSLPRNLIEEEPSPPVKARAASPLVIAILALLFSGFFLLMLVFIRLRMRNAAVDPTAREKMNRIRRAFTFDRRRRNGDRPAN